MAQMIPTYFSGNRPTGIPFLRIPVGDFLFIVVFMAICLSLVSTLFAVFWGVRGLFAGFSAAFILGGSLWLFVRDNWGRTVPKNREVFSTIFETLSSEKVLVAGEP